MESFELEAEILDKQAYSWMKQLVLQLWAIVSTELNSRWCQSAAMPTVIYGVDTEQTVSYHNT